MASRLALQLLRRARGNDGPAQAQLGTLYLQGGEGISVNLEAALMWLTRASENGMTEASALIARHIPPAAVPDGTALLTHYERAAHEGDATAALHAGIAWGARDGQEAATRRKVFLQQAAAGGSVEAQVLLARSLEDCHPAPVHSLPPLLARAAQAGHGEALSTLAERVWQQRDIRQVDTLRQAVREDDPTTAYRLGVVLRLAADTEGNAGHHRESAQWLERAALAGHPEARLEYGALLAGTIASPLRRNYKRAARFLALALSDGVAEAGIVLAQLHAQPKFPGRSSQAALAALLKAAHLGAPEAQYRLGVALKKSLRSNYSITSMLECARWLHEARTLGHPDAGAVLSEIAAPPPRYDEDTIAYQEARVSAVETESPHVALRLRLMAAFGLSKAESVLFEPVEADKTFCVLVRRALSGGKERARLVQVTEGAHRALLDAAKHALAGDAHDEVRGPPSAQLRQLAQIARRFSIEWGRFFQTTL